MDAVLTAAEVALCHLEYLSCNWHARRAFLDLQAAVEEVNMAIRDEEIPPEDADIDIMEGSGPADDLNIVPTAPPLCPHGIPEANPCPGCQLPPRTATPDSAAVDAESDRVAVESLAERLFAAVFCGEGWKADVTAAFEAAEAFVAERNRRRAKP